MLETLSRQRAWGEGETVKSFKERVQRGERPKIPEHLTQISESTGNKRLRLLLDLIPRCWSQDLNERPSAETLLILLQEVMEERLPEKKDFQGYDNDQTLVNPRSIIQ